MRTHSSEEDVDLTKCFCRRCGWQGIIKDTIPDAAGYGNLLCPQCENVVTPI